MKTQEMRSFIFMLILGIAGSAQVRRRDGQQLNIRCRASGSLIVVSNAYYGALPKGRCGEDEAATLTTVSGLCDGKDECSFGISDGLFSGTTCASTNREVLIVTYKCQSASSTASTGQGKTQTLSCSGGSFITITSATYSRGRTCGDANALSIVEGLCNDQATCSITADDATFTASTCNANQRESLRVAYVCTIPRGAGYFYWGETTCPGSSQTIYAGLMGGSPTSVKNGANYLCLPTDPTYLNSNSTENDVRSGVTVTTLQETTGIFPTASNDRVLQCAYCQTTKSSVVTTLIGTTTCPTGWNVEYTGYLVSPTEGSATTSMDYACLSSTPATLSSSAGATGTSGVTLVEQNCESITCTSNEEIACTVCTY